jgi:hypothetical protein
MGWKDKSSNPDTDKRFSLLLNVRLTLVSTQPPIQRAPPFFLGVRVVRVWCEALNSN